MRIQNTEPYSGKITESSRKEKKSLWVSRKKSQVLLKRERKI